MKTGWIDPGWFCKKFSSSLYTLSLCCCLLVMERKAAMSVQWWLGYEHSRVTNMDVNGTPRRHFLSITPSELKECRNMQRKLYYKMNKRLCIGSRFKVTLTTVGIHFMKESDEKLFKLKRYPKGWQLNYINCCKLMSYNK